MDVDAILWAAHGRNCVLDWGSGLSSDRADPVLERDLPAESLPSLLETLRRRFEPQAWVSLAVLVVTGLTQMAANPNYQGNLAVQNRWSASILIKHAFIALMVALVGYQTWFLQPHLNRLALRRVHRLSNESQEASVSLLRRRSLLIRLNLLFSVVVLVLTAIARTA